MFGTAACAACSCPGPPAPLANANTTWLCVSVSPATAAGYCCCPPVYELKGVGLDGKEKLFQKPWAMTTTMFLGE